MATRIVDTKEILQMVCFSAAVAGALGAGITYVLVESANTAKESERLVMQQLASQQLAKREEACRDTETKLGFMIRRPFENFYDETCSWVPKFRAPARKKTAA